jgi:integrase
LVKSAVRGIRRELGSAPLFQKSAIVAQDIGKILDTCDNSLLGARDRALIALGFSGAMRRSELVALNLKDVVFVEKGADIRIRRSKTDQTGEGHILAIPSGANLYPVAAVRSWIAAAGLVEMGAPLFRKVAKGGRLGWDRLTPHSVAALVKKRAKMVGIDPAKVAGHSLRVGFVTSAVDHGASPAIIAEHSRHKSLDMILTYTRRANRFTNHSGAGFL